MSDIKNITVLGSGIMGHGIAQVTATAGYNINLRDIKQDLLDKALEKIKWSLDKLVSKEKITQQKADEIYSRIRPVVDLKESVKDCDLVIEAVPETMDLKRKVYSELSEVAKKDTIFATNTSTLPITEIAKTTDRPENFIGVHFFNPPQLMKLVEVIPGEKTNKELTDKIIRFVESVSKQPVLCKKDVAGFIVNRIFIPLVHEACYELERTNAKKEEIDSAVKFGLGFPMGIFELADFTGMDVIQKATEEMHSRDKKVINPHPKVKSLYESNKLGQKSGSGFYEYSQEQYARVPLSEELAQKYDPVPLVANMLNNAAWLVTNKVTDIEEIEKALQLGMGLKKPLFETAKKEFGISKIVKKLEELSKQEGSFYEPDPLLSSMMQ